VVSRAGFPCALALVALLGAWVARSLGAQSPDASSLRVELSPESPVQGTVFAITVSSADGPVPTLEARFAGEPIRFRTREDGSQWAVAAVPVDGDSALALQLTATWPDGRSQRLDRGVPVTRGRYAMERLSVAPEYGAPPPPAIAARIEAEAERARAVARGAHDTPAFWSPGDFVRPRATRVTSGFGNGREFNGRIESRHTGTDFQGAVGDPVVAAAPGVVRLVDRFYLGGNVVYIDHGGGLSTGYLHLSETRVAAGDTVAAGQRIGSVGATGRVTGPHLHWILRFGGITVDPLSVLGLKLP
jgi:murein DD-endopeptidase MepM/ murein hydrolase activator NlpD